METENLSVTQSSSPTLEPTASASYGYGWKVLRGHLGTLVGITFISILLNMLGGSLDDLGMSEMEQTLLWLATLIFSMVIVNPVSVGSSWAFLKAVRGESVSVGNMFEAFRRNLLSAVFTPILTTTISGLVKGILVFALAIVILIPLEFAAKPYLIGGVILLLVLSTGLSFYLSIRLSFANFLVLDKNLSPLAAVKQSWSMTQGYLYELIALSMLSLPILLGGLLLLLVGILPALAWVGCASASMYQAVLIKESQK